MKLKISSIVITVVILVFLILAGRYGFTVISIKDAENTVQSEVFDPAAYVDGIWESKLIPAFNEKAVELPKILSEMKPDANGTASIDSLIPIANKYGLITEGEAHVYIVKGSGVISSVDIESSKGTVEVSLDGYNGPIIVRIYIGPRLPGDDTSIRDATGLIKFGDFKEQTEFGKAAKEMNDRVLQHVLGTLDKENLIGKTVIFKGAFTIRTFNLLSIDLKEIYIIPIEIKLGD